MRKIPNPITWFFDSTSLMGKKYLRDLEFIKENLDTDMLVVNPVFGVQIENLRQCHGALEELVARAHELNLKIALRLPNVEGFFNGAAYPSKDAANAQALLYPIGDPKSAQALAMDYECTADENGFARIAHEARWARPKIRPIRNELLRVYAFQKTREGFYQKCTLSDVTQRARIVESMPHSMSLEIDAGRENAGKTLFALVAQFYNWEALYGDHYLQKDLDIMEKYSDIPFDGICLDEEGYMLLNFNDVQSGAEPPFRGRMYSSGQEAYYQSELKLDLRRLLFDMRYAPEGEEGVRIRAVNRYFDESRKPPLRLEWQVAKRARELFGEDAYLCCHNTFHNDLDNDEVWHTACNWWSLPRAFGHTDENITFPVRMGVMLAAEELLMLDMFYSKDWNAHYRHMIEAAPFNCREFHHAYDDFYWGSSFTEPELLKNVRMLDRQIARLNEFQKVYPKLDLLVIYGTHAQNNWYPDEAARGLWDVDKNMRVLDKCDALWKAGYRLALAPDIAVEDGRIQVRGDKILFHGHAFDHMMFLYPKYAKKETYACIDRAYDAGVPIAVVGRADIDFDAEPARLRAPVYPEFGLSLAETIGCPKSAIPGGCVYTDGSFALVSENGLMRNEPTKFDFAIDGVRYTGEHTGLLAYRKGEALLCTPGSALFIDGKPE